MKSFARVEDGTVVELIRAASHAELGDLYHPDFVDLLIAAPSNVREGWSYDGETFTAPPPPPPEPPAPPIVLSPAEFFGRMTDEEAEAIDKAVRARPIRFRSIWAGIADQGRDLQEDSILWPVLRDEIVKLYGEERADALLARPN